MAFKELLNAKEALS